jgi:hypothetical protein
MVGDIEELVSSIKISTDECERLAIKIHDKISPVGLSGKTGVLYNNEIIMTLDKILVTSRYTANVLSAILSSIIKNPDVADKLRASALEAYKNLR